jgi:hypothetical protein
MGLYKILIFVIMRFACYECEDMTILDIHYRN